MSGLGADSRNAAWLFDSKGAPARGYRGAPSTEPFCVDQSKEANMAKGEQRGNREAKKPKKQKIKVIAAAPSQKTAAWQPSFASGKKK
jgi:hypothetical protein